MNVDHNGRSGSIYSRDIFRSLNMKVCCVFSLESPHRGDSNENIQYIILIKETERNHPKLSKICWYRIFYAPNFGEVEGAYWFGPIRPSVHLSVRPSVYLSLTFGS